MHNDPLPSPRPLAGAGTVELAPGVRVGSSCLVVSFSRSGGPGGQNVNKLSTRCELRVALSDVPINAGAKARLAALAGRRLTDDGVLQIIDETHRSQTRNREECFARLRELIVQAQVVPKPRRKTKPTKGSKERRLSEKKTRGAIKRTRGGGHDE